MASVRAGLIRLVQKALINATRFAEEQKSIVKSTLQQNAFTLIWTKISVSFTV